MWSMLSLRTLGGTSIGPVHPVAGRWRKQVGGIGGGEHVFDLSDARYALPQPYWRDLFTEVRRSLAVSWDDTAVYAGVITGCTWDHDTKRLTVRHAEAPRHLLSKRLPFTRDVVTVAGRAPRGSTAFWGKSLRGIARGVVNVAASDGDERRRIKIDVGADESGTVAREWKRYNFATLDDMLSDVSDSEGGPEVAFEPEWRSDGLWHRLLLGSPLIEGEQIGRVRGSRGSSVAGFTTLSDAQEQAVTTWAIGAGSEEDMLVEPREMPVTLDMPELDQVVSFKNVDKSDALAALAAEHAVGHQFPSQTRSFDLTIGPDIDPAQIRLGTRLSIMSPADEWEPEQWHEGRVVAVESQWGAGVGDVLRVSVI